MPSVPNILVFSNNRPTTYSAVTLVSDVLAEGVPSVTITNTSGTGYLTVRSGVLQYSNDGSTWQPVGSGDELSFSSEQFTGDGSDQDPISLSTSVTGQLLPSYGAAPSGAVLTVSGGVPVWNTITTVSTAQKAALDAANSPSGSNPFLTLADQDTRYKGWYATSSALIAAYPTGSDGWYASVGSTDTFWMWDSDTTAWVDTGSNVSGVHNDLVERDAANAHPIGAITNLQNTLDQKYELPAGGSTGQFLIKTPNGTSWGTPQDTTYSAGTGLSLAGTTFSIDGTGATPGQYLKKSADGFTWDTPQTAASVNKFQLTRPDGDQGLHLVIKQASTGVLEDASTVLDTLTNAADRVKVTGWTGLEWLQCPADGFGTPFEKQTIVADLTGVSQPTYLFYQWVTADTQSDWYSSAFPVATESDSMSGTAYTAGTGLSLTGTEFSINGTGATNGQVLTKSADGFTWTTPQGATYSAGSGLSLTGTTFSLDGTGAVNGQYLKKTAAGFSWGLPTNNTYTAGSGITLTDGAFALDVSNYSASSVKMSTTGSSGFQIVNDYSFNITLNDTNDIWYKSGIHCRNLGGTLNLYIRAPRVEFGARYGGEDGSGYGAIWVGDQETASTASKLGLHVKVSDIFLTSPAAPDTECTLNTPNGLMRYPGTEGTTGQVLTKTETGFTWSSPQGSTYSAGTGLSLSDTTFELSGAALAQVGQVLVKASNGVAWTAANNHTHTTSDITGYARADIQITSADLVSGIYTVTEAKAGCLAVLNNSGELVLLPQTQSGDSVQLDFTDVTMTGTWTVRFQAGGSTSGAISLIPAIAVADADTATGTVSVREVSIAADGTAMYTGTAYTALYTWRVAE